MIFTRRIREYNKSAYRPVQGVGGSLSRRCLCAGGVSFREIPPPVDRQTPVKILPYPKLRLRAVIIGFG